MIGGLAALALLGAGTGAAWAESAAEIAVREAKQYAGTEINVIWEAGLQSLGPQNFSGPKVYRENQMRIGDTIYGFPDDGDVFILYYRKDIFEEMGLSVPTTWDEFYEVSKAITDAKAPEVYGAGFMRVRGLLHYFYQERARNEGCKFFDAESMKATINGPGCVKALAGMVKDNTTMPPGIEVWGFVETLAAFNAGQTAMLQSWPPVGRWSAGYGTDDIAMQWVPPSVVAGKVGYALPPGGHPQLAAGFAMAVSSSSKNKDAAYLYIQWINSIDISHQRVQLPYALRDPFRKSHFSSPEYQSRWPDAKHYLEAAEKGAVSGLLDLSIINTFAYIDALAAGLQSVMSGGDPQEELDGVAAKWDALTEKVGVDAQREAYMEWASKPAAYPGD
jgi:multiple sugar transport system substrate-binding protein